MNIGKNAVGATGSISGAASILGSWQICHNLCLGVIALLGIMGISLTGMPFLFFVKIAVPLWIIALVLLGVIFYLYVKKHCISKSLLIINSGLLIAGIPFQALQPFQFVFWTVGGLFVISGLVLYIRGRKKKTCERCEHDNT